MLVADKIDDERGLAANPGLLDEQRGDRTHIVGLGGRVFVSVPTPAGYKRFPVARVPVQKIVHLEPYFFTTRATLTQPPDFSMAKSKVEALLQLAAERMAQLGIKLEWSDVIDGGVIDATILAPGVGFGGSPPVVTGTISGNLRELCQRLPPKAAGSIPAYFVKALTGGGGGAATIPKLYGTTFGNRVLVSDANNGAFTLAHELMHLLLNCQHGEGLFRYPGVYGDPNSIWLTYPAKSGTEFIGNRRAWADQRPAVLIANPTILHPAPPFPDEEE